MEDCERNRERDGGESKKIKYKSSMLLLLTKNNEMIKNNMMKFNFIFSKETVTYNSIIFNQHTNRICCLFFFFWCIFQ